MFIKTYRGTSVKELLARTRDELGPGALVLSTRLVAAAGWRGWMGFRNVELTAALPRDVSGDRPAGRRPDQPARTGGEIAARLSAAGVSAALANEVEQALPAARRRGASSVTLHSALASRLAPLTVPNEEFAPIEVFVGPPGVGKTTTIAKIAAQQRARHGRALTLVSADGYRVGAVEQLRLFADIIGSPFKVARSAAELRRLLQAARGPLLVDTPGRSAGDDVARDLFDLLGTAKRVRTHLVVPATGSARDVSRLVEHYRAASPSRIALARVDETDSLSSLIDSLRDTQLPVSYLGTGQHVPDDLERASGSLLAGLVLGDSPLLAARPA